MRRGDFGFRSFRCSTESTSPLCELLELDRCCEHSALMSVSFCLAHQQQAYLLSYNKVLFNVFKYIPQVVTNYQRKSTAGLAISGAIMDLVGGILSLLQLLIDSSMQSDWSGLTGNPVKLGLAVVSITYDLTILSQHYVFFGPQQLWDDFRLCVIE